MRVSVQGEHAYGVEGQIVFQNESYQRHVDELRFSVIGTVATEVILDNEWP